MFVVGVSDHIMVAHSLRGETFGPAQRLHGATYDVRVEVLAPELDADGIVVDIGLLRTVLRETLTPLDYQNLDDVPDAHEEG
jgi:6-pyruvoyltetrahydropterin/6-carboxytetrahydropterin synthase